MDDSGLQALPKWPADTTRWDTLGAGANTVSTVQYTTLYYSSKHYNATSIRVLVEWWRLRISHTFCVHSHTGPAITYRKSVSTLHSMLGTSVTIPPATPPATTLISSTRVGFLSWLRSTGHGSRGVGLPGHRSLLGITPLSPAWIP